MTFFSLLQLIFITLKLTNYIDWSWWLVLLPIEIFVGLILLYVILTFLANWLEERAWDEMCKRRDDD